MTTDRQLPNARDCKHGQLARSCEICELEMELADAKATTAKQAATVALIASREDLIALCHRIIDEKDVYLASDLAERLADAILGRGAGGKP